MLRLDDDELQMKSRGSGHRWADRQNALEGRQPGTAVAYSILTREVR